MIVEYTIDTVKHYDVFYFYIQCVIVNNTLITSNHNNVVNYLCVHL